MEALQYLIKIIYKNKWWFILSPIVVAIVIFFFTRNLPKTYQVSTTIYTGLASGFNIQSEGDSKLDPNLVNNEMDNLTNIIKLRKTLQNVAIRLFAQHMIYGDPKHDNYYILAVNYNDILSKTPKNVLDLIDKQSEEKSVANLEKYLHSDTKNFLYGLLNWSGSFYSLDALSKISVKRLGNSDMLEVAYSCSDPGITSNTLKLLNSEFVQQYQDLQFGETNSVIDYFKAELEKKSIQLRSAEDSLIRFNVRNRVINYEEQTKQMAVQSRDFNLEYSEAVILYNTSTQLLNDLEKQILENAELIKNNDVFIKQTQDISDLTYQLSVLGAFERDTTQRSDLRANKIKAEIQQKEDDLASFIAGMSSEKYTKEGLSTDDVVKQWFLETLNNVKAKATMKGLEVRKNNLDSDYLHYSPVGAILKRKEREINLIENAYLNIQTSLNYALTRRQNLQMSSATLQVLNEPAFPLESLPSKRKMLVLGGVIATIAFVFLYFIILELMDRTLKDKKRAQSFTKGNVLGGFPDHFRGKNKKYEQEGYAIAAEYMYNTLSFYFTANFPNIINLISIDNGTGKSFLANQLLEKCLELGIKARLVSWNTDFNPQSKEYIWATQLSDFISYSDEEILLIEYPPIAQYSIPQPLLQAANLNLVVLSAKASWTDRDRILFERLESECGKVPVGIYLNYMSRISMYDFIKMFPPYTKMRKFFFQLFRFELKGK